MDKQRKEEDILKMISLFRERELLWNTNSFSYRRNDLKKKALEEIGKEMNMTEEAVKKRIKSLRSTYVIEKRKVEHSKKSGCDAADVYQPSLFWYEEMSFLDNYISARKSVNNVTNELTLIPCPIICCQI
ncbi:uncharacterized protein [Musca autumnalis]|uniref:uncharacterized protein n=1 Tax=Musca autumnalis TaxID=221902 RepID=UPI003CEE425E